MGRESNTEEEEGEGAKITLRILIKPKENIILFLPQKYIYTTYIYICVCAHI